MSQECINEKVTLDCRKLLYTTALLSSMLLAGVVPAYSSGEVDAVAELQEVKSISLKSKIVDTKGEPVVGATVVIDGTTTGTVTDFDGNFAIEAPAKSSMTISFIGFESLKLSATEIQSKSTITLGESTKSLDEVLVVGYGQVKRANLAGSVTNLEMKELEDIPAPNLSSALMGTMPGVYVSEATGNPIADATIKVRINGSWNGGDPLYVIDGFVRDASTFNMLDPTEIDNISVLKDASAAIYGVRGSDGVILVTTKRGKAGKTKISYSGSYGVGVGVNMPDVMSAYEQATALNDLYRENLINGSSSVAYFSDEELDKFKSTDYNWLDMGWKNAQNTRHTLNVSGGSENVKYFISGSYMYADGNFANLNKTRFSFRSGVDVKFTEQFSGNFTMSYSQKSTSSPLNSKDAEPDRMYGTFSDLARMPRWIPAYIDGMAVGNGMASTDTHPLEIFNSGSYRNSYNNSTTLSGKLNYDVKKIKGLKASFAIDYSRSNGNGKQLSKPYTVYVFDMQNKLDLYDIDGNKTEDQPTDGHLFSNTVSENGVKVLDNTNQLQESASFSYNYQITPAINYANKFGLHDISAALIYEQSESGGNGLSWVKEGMVINGIEVADGYSSIKSVSSDIDVLGRRMGFIGRLNYTYADKYMLEATARYEASTNFAKGYRWGMFPSVALSWRLSEEDFFKDNVSFMDVLKVRASYGLLGNDKVNSIDQYRETYGSTTDKYLFGTSSSTVIAPIGEGLVVLNSTWEKTSSYNWGIDTRFFECFTFNIDGFFKHSYDILDEKKSEFPQNSGISSSTPKLNYGIQNAWGAEIEIGFQKRLNKNWELNAKGGFGWADSKVIRKSQNQGILGTWQDEEGRRRGGEVGYLTWKGVNDDGLARTWDDVNAYVNYLQSHVAEGGAINVLGKGVEDLRPGMLMYEDRGTTLLNQTPDGVINSDGDNCIISEYDNAPYHYSFTLGFKYRNFKFDALFDGEFGYNVLFEKGFWTTASGGYRSGNFLSDQSNQLREWYGNYAIADVGTKELINAGSCKYPRLDGESFHGERSDFWMRNGHALRLRQINLSYTLPVNYAKAIGLESLRVFANASNLLTIINPYPYKDAYVGFWSDYPQVRSFNFGLNVTL